MKLKHTEGHVLKVSVQVNLWQTLKLLSWGKGSGDSILNLIVIAETGLFPLLCITFYPLPVVSNGTKTK